MTKSINIVLTRKCTGLSKRFRCLVGPDVDSLDVVTAEKGYLNVDMSLGVSEYPCSLSNHLLRLRFQSVLGLSFPQLRRNEIE